MNNQQIVSHELPRITQKNPTETLDLTRKPNISEFLVRGFLFFCGFVSIFTTLGIVLVLGRESFLLFSETYAVSGNQAHHLSLVEFLTGTVWQPKILKIGIWPLLTSTLVTSGIAMLVALPLGLGAAIYLSEYSSPRSRNFLKPILEVLAGVPTVVYGYFALTFMTPLLRATLFPSMGAYNMLSAGIVMGIMIIPMVASMSEDALNAVPRSLREGAYGLGSTRLEVSLRVVVPAAFSGIVAAFILAVSRAVGETMIVAIAAGAGPNFTLDPTQAAETMTGYIARISTGDIAYNTLDYNSIFAIGLMLFLLTLVLNMVSRFIVRRFREAYE